MDYAYIKGAKAYCLEKLKDKAKIDDAYEMINDPMFHKMNLEIVKMKHSGVNQRYITANLDFNHFTDNEQYLFERANLKTIRYPSGIVLE